MKITRIECLIASIGPRNVTFVRTHTDEGLHGIGEAYTVGPDLATANWVDYFAEQLVGQDPCAVEFLWSLMYQGARFPPGSSGLAALSGIDQSLWDILGKSVGLPVYQLLGGKIRDRVPVYLDIAWDGPTAQQRDAVHEALDEGYRAFKTHPVPNAWREMLWGDALSQARRQLAELRELVGPDVEIGLDAHAQFLSPAVVLQLADAIAEIRPFFLEEPLRMENRAAMADLRKKMPFPLATGECLYTKFELDELVRTRGADILQPDVCICGGLTEMRKIASNAEAHDISIAPHNPTGPLATVVNTHFALATTNCPILEYRPQSDAELAMVPGATRPEDGLLDVTGKPGWGVDLDDNAIRARPYERAWHRGDRFNPDGSVAYI